MQISSIRCSCILYSAMVDLNIFLRAYIVLVFLCLNIIRVYLHWYTYPNLPSPTVLPSSNNFIFNNSGSGTTSIGCYSTLLMGDGGYGKAGVDTECFYSYTGSGTSSV